MRSTMLFILCVSSLLIYTVHGWINNNHKSNLPHGPTSIIWPIPGVLRGDQPDGKALYIKYCLTCHQADGAGVRGMFPPLAGNVKITGTSTDIIKIVLFGLKGPIVVNGRDYDQAMPPQGYLTDKQISDILSFVRNEWGNKAPPITPEEVVKVRKSKK